jgi:serine/threonine protein kinase
MGRERHRERDRQRRRNGTNDVLVDGRRYSVQRRERIRGHTYLVLEQLAPPPRERWLVLDTAAGGPRVMLVLPSDDSTSQHIRVLRNVESNSLPRILNFAVGDEQTRVVVPWVKGIDMHEYLKRVEKKKVDPPEPFHAVRLILELARALRALHRNAQVIHGDIKPANLILTRKSSHVSMIDFGSAWPIGKTGVRCAADGISGAFAAPELTCGGVVNERADQFSASVVLYQLLTGVIPYDDLGGKAGWPEWRHDANVAAPPSKVALSSRHVPRKVWREIDALVLKGIDLDPGRRFAHSTEWVDAIDAVFLQLRLRQGSNQDRETLWDRLCHWLTNRLDVKDPDGVSQ